MAAWSDASSGDLRPVDPAPHGGGALSRWAAGVTGAGGRDHRDHPGEVHWVEQLHGATVVTVPGPEHREGPKEGPEQGAEGIGTSSASNASGDPGMVAVGEGPGDALVSRAPSVALAVLTADCGSLALGSAEGVFAAVHAGWRGLMQGVVQETVGVMRTLGATDVVGALGPCIHVECYEFSEPDLAAVCGVVGEGGRGRTSSGRPALDIPAAVSATLEACGVSESPGVDACTACHGRYFSHRARRDGERQALLVWAAPGSRPAARSGGPRA